MKRVLWISSLAAAIVVGLVIARMPASAHHASAPFYDDTKSVEAVGTVARFIFRNPHSFLFEVAICLAVVGSASYILDTLGHPGKETN